MHQHVSLFCVISSVSCHLSPLPVLPSYINPTGLSHSLRWVITPKLSLNQTHSTKGAYFSKSILPILTLEPKNVRHISYFDSQSS